VATMFGCLPTQALAFLAVFVYATQAIAFEWKPGLMRVVCCCFSFAVDSSGVAENATQYTSV